MSAGPVDERSRKLRIRVTAVLLGLLAVGFYVGFIALTMWSN